VVTDRSSRGHVRMSSGRIDKRNAILDAAFTVFSRQGYATTCVKEIAAEAGVAKPTVYNHMNDKATLFREAVGAAAERVGAATVAAVEACLDSPAETEDTLHKVGEELARALRDPERWALRRLACAESAQFPDLVSMVQATSIQPIVRALGNKVARMTLAGLLRTDDPDVAAAQFVALVQGPLEAATCLGTRTATDDQVNAVVRAAVQTFTRAFCPDRPELPTAGKSGG
jgi:TetR/AcrR family transcriptional repressor of mexJK operon